MIVSGGSGIPEAYLAAVPGRHAALAIARPGRGPAPDPALWEAELIYAAFTQGNMPAMPLDLVVLPDSQMNAPVHVRDQIDAYKRDRPGWEVFTFGVALSAVRVVDVFTAYHRINRRITRGRRPEELAADGRFVGTLNAALDAAYPGDRSIAAVIIVDPRGLDDLAMVPADRTERAKLAGELTRGQIGAVVAVAGGRAVPPGS